MADFTDEQLAIFEKQEIDCTDIMLLLGDLHDHNLPQCLEDRLNQHIECCPTCQELQRGYELVIALAHQMKEPELPEGARSRLHNALNKKLGLNLK